MSVVVRINGSIVPAASQSIVMQTRRATPSSAATDNALGATSVPDDPQFRFVADLRGATKCRIYGDIGGSLVAATKIRIQYHPGGDPTVATGDAGWAVLADTAGSHSLSTAFYSSELSVPVAARVNNCVVRPAIFSGDGVADPIIRALQIVFYP